MSASEQLKRLVEEREWPPDWPDGPLNALVDALPEIRAVVEAAEKHLDMEWAAFAEYAEPEDSAPNTSVTHQRMADALTALEKKLEER